MFCLFERLFGQTRGYEGLTCLAHAHALPAVPKHQGYLRESGCLEEDRFDFYAEMTPTNTHRPFHSIVWSMYVAKTRVKRYSMPTVHIARRLVPC